MIDKCVNYDVHDWPTAELGLKLGGLMLLRDTGGDIDEEETFSADEQSDFEEASQEAPDDVVPDVYLT
jgi:hypothetical protein